MGQCAMPRTGSSSSMKPDIGQNIQSFAVPDVEACGGGERREAGAAVAQAVSPATAAPVALY